MSTFVTAQPQPPSPDPTKHVNYTLGMVLGVDDFTQEFAYLSGRDQLLARELIGYGTACGLKVEHQANAGNPQILVSPGIAVTPAGQFVSVSAAQCALLNQWLQAHSAEVAAHLNTSPPSGVLKLYLTLCYRECATDAVPIPGEPCRDEDEAMAPSRLADDFKLELRFAATDQSQEDATRDFVAWLNQVEVTSAEAGGTFATLTEWVKAIREAALPPASPPASPPDFMIGAPPASLRIRSEEACEFLRVAFRLWTTELRPMWLGPGATCAGAPPDEACVLLAELEVPVSAGLVSGNVAVIEDRRPYLVHLRMLQEWLICNQRQAALPSDSVTSETAFGRTTNAGVSPHFSRADHTHGTPPDPIPLHVANTSAHAAHNIVGDVTGTLGAAKVGGILGVPVQYPTGTPADGQVLKMVGGQWRPAAEAGGGAAITPGATVRAETSFGLAANAGAASEYSRADHTHGAPPDPIPPHVTNTNAHAAHSIAGDVTGALNATSVQRLRSIPLGAQTPTNGQVLTFVAADNSWSPRNPAGGGATTLAGDVVGNSTANTVARLQNMPLSADRPEPGQVLQFEGTTPGVGKWVAANPPQPAGAFVTHPPRAGEFGIVAAGLVQADGTAPFPTYNKLFAKVIEVGEVLVTFSDYRQPTEIPYVVKALIALDREARDRVNALAPVVLFDRFTDDGFVLFVADRNEPVDPNRLERYRFMIEVSQYKPA